MTSSPRRSPRARRGKSVIETSERIRSGPITALSMCVPNSIPGVYRAKSGGAKRRGSTAAAKTPLKLSAATTCSRAWSAAGPAPSCSFFLTRRDAQPDDSTPST